MNEDFQVIKSCLMIRMPREVDHHQARRIRETADRYIEGKEISHVIFDFELTDFMDSSGIGAVLGRYKKLANKNGVLCIAEANKNVNKIFKNSFK